MRSRVADALGKGVGRSQARPGCRPASTAHCVSNDAWVRGAGRGSVYYCTCVHSSHRSQFSIPQVALWIACVRHPCAITRQKSERSDVFVCAASCMIHGVPRAGSHHACIHTPTSHGQFLISRFVLSLTYKRHPCALTRQNSERSDIFVCVCILQIQTYRPLPYSCTVELHEPAPRWRCARIGY